MKLIMPHRHIYPAAIGMRIAHYYIRCPASPRATTIHHWIPGSRIKEKDNAKQILVYCRSDAAGGKRKAATVGTSCHQEKRGLVNVQNGLLMIFEGSFKIQG
jgi:hypothetical protein